MRYLGSFRLGLTVRLVLLLALLQGSIAQAALTVTVDSTVPADLSALSIGDTVTINFSVATTAPEALALGMRADGGSGLIATGNFTAPGSIFNFLPTVPFGGIGNTPPLLGVSADGTVNLFQGVSLSAAAGAGPDSFSVEFTASADGAGTITIGQVAGHPEDIYNGGDNVYNSATVAYTVGGGGPPPPPPPPVDPPVVSVSASLAFAANLFGDSTSTISNPLPVSLEMPDVFEVPNALHGRLAPFDLELELTSGRYLFLTVPTVTPPGLGGDIELGPALTGGGTAEPWAVESVSVDATGAVLVVSLAPGAASAPVGAGELISIGAGVLPVEELVGSLGVVGGSLSVRAGAFDGSADMLIWDAEIATSIDGVTLVGATTVIDEAGGVDSSGNLIFLSEPITLDLGGACNGFPDGGLFIAAPNCGPTKTFQFDPINDRIYVRVVGAGLEDLMASPGSRVSIHEAGGGCEPYSELASTSALLPDGYARSAFLDFSPPVAEDPSFTVCIVKGDGTPATPQALHVFVSADFGSIFLRPSPESQVSMTIEPRCYGDFNDDGRVNNLDALEFRSCFGCVGPTCNRACDYDLDGRISNSDALAFRQAFGSVCEVVQKTAAVAPTAGGLYRTFGEAAGDLTLATSGSASLLALLFAVVPRRRRAGEVETAGEANEKP